MRAHSFAWSLPLLLSGVSFACGQQVGDPAAGQRLAEASCMRCHGVANAQQPAPTLSAIAAMPTTSAQSLGVFLKTSHGNMPNLILTNSERDDVIAYILSLRR
jgi:mono/diheme cytochrome c family protein